MKVRFGASVSDPPDVKQQAANSVKVIPVVIVDGRYNTLLICGPESDETNISDPSQSDFNLPTIAKFRFSNNCIMENLDRNSKIH